MNAALVMLRLISVVVAVVAAVIVRFPFLQKQLVLCGLFLLVFFSNKLPDFLDESFILLLIFGFYTILLRWFRVSHYTFPFGVIDLEILISYVLLITKNRTGEASNITTH